MHRAIRTVAAVSMVAVALSGGPLPASAYQVVSDTGTTGAYTIVDDSGEAHGARCFYETASTDLDRISVRGPRFVHGAHPNLQWIGYRFLIQRNRPPTDDGIFETIHRSTIRFAKADDNENPHSFARRAWTAPESTAGHYRVQVVLLWYRWNGHDPSDQTGKVVIRYQYYRQDWNGTFDIDTEYCSEVYT